jgi:predicted dienelactone hydrolase
MTGGWDQFVAYAGQVGVRSSSSLWQPITDARIRAVVPMAPEGAWLFGDRGLEAVNRPMMIIGGTADVINFYDLEAAYIFNHLGTPDRVMISFVGQDHMMIWDPQQKDRMAHFAVAFLGYHLQGRAEYARYFSEEFLSQYPDLAWGVVTQ